MSSIAFHSPSLPDVRVSGRERARFGGMGTRALQESLGIGGPRFFAEETAEQARKISRLLAELPDYVSNVRERLTETLELQPDRWRWPDFYFDHPITGYHVAQAAERR